MLKRFARLARAGILGWLAPRRFVCVVCGHGVGGFLPYRNGTSSLSGAMRQLGLNGSDLDNFECPRCGATDRLRHLKLYLEAEGLLARMKGARVLHFAPEKKLVEMIQASLPAEYLLADIEPPSADVIKVDITRMPFPDVSFDVLIANHVLEHVDGLEAALKEIERVLAPGGFAVLQTPYSLVLTRTFEDPGIATAQARLELYGQEDHVRLFGNDIVGQITGLSGLRSRVRAHTEALPGIDAKRHGVNPREPLFLFQKAS
ncbi:class I SAM-dependent methyltransferase [Luteibacter sp. Lutesp34]|uniref:class I SAM-dependent methyltransferase n=1 Tax=Luteibacter sp. Lutesp34 TaxID=3243030 RepID=UPI0039B60982